MAKILFNQTFSELETAAKDSKDSNGNPISVKQYIVTLMDDDISNRKSINRGYSYRFLLYNFFFTLSQEPLFYFLIG